MSKVEITLHTYSGREDPKWSIDYTDHHFREIVNILPTHEHKHELEENLGYRGFTIRHDEALYVVPKSTNIPLEKLLLASAAVGLEHTANSKEPCLPDTVIDHVLQELDKSTHAAIPDGKGKKIDLPPYEPNKWNNRFVQPYNNCYNYANNMITNTFAQPGRKHHLKLQCIQGETVKKYAIADGLAVVEGWEKKDIKELKEERNLVALVIWPYVDFHWYRLDNTLFFSHKPGNETVRDYDNLKQRIINPKTCNRGPYTEFTAFMRTDPNSVQIK